MHMQQERRDMGVSRTQIQGPAKGGFGLVESAHRLEQSALVEPDLWGGGVRFDRQLVRRQSVARPAHHLQRRRLVGKRRRIAGVEGQGRLEFNQGLFVPVLHLKNAPQAEVGRGKRPVHCQQAVKNLGGFAETPQFPQALAVFRHQVFVWAAFEGRHKPRFRLGVAAVGNQCPGQGRRRRFRGFFRRLGQMRNGSRHVIADQ